VGDFKRGKTSGVQECKVVCKDFPYFAFPEADRACYCGQGLGETTPIKKHTDDGSCDKGGCTGRGCNVKMYSHVPTKVVFLGCYTDLDPPKRAFESPPVPVKSTEECSKMCAGKKFFALQAGTECRCGDEFRHGQEYPQKAASGDECGPKCGGEENMVPERFCGTNWVNAIYSAAQRLPIRYVGCFKDSGSDRALKVKMKTRGYNTESCDVACMQYKFFALQDGENSKGAECFCGNDNLDPDTKVQDEECSECDEETFLPDPTRRCGGGF
jgi:hypothetical protein